MSRKEISIHALLAESDMIQKSQLAHCSISIHALLAESDWPGSKFSWTTTIFLSTLSLRRATALPGWWTAGPAISIHALLAESDPLKAAITAAPQQISIHALLAESDPVILFPKIPVFDFYPRSPCGERLFNDLKVPESVSFLSTLSLRRATYLSGVMTFGPGISIHALLAESDV